MRPQDLIEKKRDRGELSPEEIAFLIKGYTRDEIPDYQMSAFLMAGFLNGMSPSETAALLHEMLHSGTVLTHDDIPEPKVDKHSTGGVGDKTSLVLGPVAAACGLCVPMISGRALAHTGGTLDKLESIPGFRTNLELSEFRAVLKKCGLGLIGQTKEIAPADRKIYALRDLTATVPFKPFIVASILSKKIAEGCEGLVLDVKFGNGAFMKNLADGRELAILLKDAATRLGKKVIALLTNMNQPLGQWVGNAVETQEAIDVLKGNLQGDFAELSIELSAQMLIAGGVDTSIEVARNKVISAITSGRGLEKFRECIRLQGGDPRVLDRPDILPKANHSAIIGAERSGFVTAVATDEIGRIVMDWGGGRRRVEDLIDHSVGLQLHVRPGDRIQAGDPIATAYFNIESRLPEMTERIKTAYSIGDEAPTLLPLIQEVL